MSLDNGESGFDQPQDRMNRSVKLCHMQVQQRARILDALVAHQGFHQAGGDLFQYLQAQAYIPEYQVRWRWKPNSVAIWDNRSTQHYAVMDYPPCHRKMNRATIEGDRPF